MFLQQWLTEPRKTRCFCNGGLQNRVNTQCFCNVGSQNRVKHRVFATFGPLIPSQSRPRPPPRGAPAEDAPRVAHRMPAGCPSYEALPPSAAPSVAPQPSPPAPTSGAGAGTTRDHRAGNSSPWGPGRAWTFWRSSTFAQDGLRTFCPRAARGPDGARFQSDIFLTFLGHFKCQQNVQKMSKKCLSAWGSLPKCPKVVRPKPTRPDKCQQKCLGETLSPRMCRKKWLGENLSPRKCQKHV